MKRNRAVPAGPDPRAPHFDAGRSSENRTLDKAQAGALSYNLSYFLRGLLLIDEVLRG